MPRNISFAMTEQQFVDGLKDVTRRLGWLVLRPGDRLMAVRKAMGLRPGEKIHRLGLIEVISVRRERLWDITPADVVREGFPLMSPPEFVEMFCAHMGCKQSDKVTRIEFKKLGEEKCNSSPTSRARKSSRRCSSLA